MDVYQTLTLLIAVAALGLSLFNTWTQHRAKSPRLQVIIRIGSENDRPYEHALLRLEITNVGNVPTTLVSRGLRLPDGRQIDPTALGGHGVESTPHFPRELKIAECHWVGADPGRIAAHLQQLGFSEKLTLRGEVKDYQGKIYLGRPFDLDLVEWTRLPTFQ